MRYRIFCCTRPRTGSPDSNSVANYTNHSRNLCGKFKNRRKRESFRFQRRAEIKPRSILARTKLKHAFFSKNSTHSLPCENCDIKNGQKQVKKFGQPWLTLTVQFSYVFSLLLFLRACQAKELPISLSLSFFIVPR